MLTYCAIMLFLLGLRIGSFAIWPALAAQLGHRIVAGFMAVLGFGGVFLLASEVLAADGSSVNFRPLADELIAGAATLLSGIIAIGILWVRQHLKARLGIELDATAREYVQDAADRAVGLLVARLERAAAKSNLTPETHDEYVSDAVDMMVEQVPDGLTRLGVTSDGVRRMLLTRLAARGVLPPDDGPRAALSH